MRRVNILHTVCIALSCEGSTMWCDKIHGNDNTKGGSRINAFKWFSNAGIFQEKSTTLYKDLISRGILYYRR